MMYHNRCRKEQKKKILPKQIDILTFAVYLDDHEEVTEILETKKKKKNNDKKKQKIDSIYTISARTWYSFPF